MDGQFNLSGYRKIPLTHDGKTYNLTVRSLGDYAMKEAAILSQSGNPYDGLQAITDDAQRLQAVKIVAEVAARPKIATFADEERFDMSMRGLSYALWRALSVEHSDEFPPNVSLSRGMQLGADFIEWFGQSRINELLQAVYESEEKDILKNSDGQTTAAA